MEEITNLMNAARTAIDNLENFIFESKKEKYINLKTVTDFMASQIESAEMTKELQVEEGYEEAKSKLNAVVSKCNELIEIFKTKGNIMVVVNESGEIITQEVKYENTQAPMETPVVMEFGVRKTEETTSNTSYEYSVPEENIELAQGMSITPMDSSVPFIANGIENQGEHQVFAPEIKEAPELADPSTLIETPIPEINILDDTAAQIGATDYSQDLDVAAVDAFLGSENQENTLKL